MPWVGGAHDSSPDSEGLVVVLIKVADGVKQVVDPFLVGGFLSFGFEEVTDDSSNRIASHIAFVLERRVCQPVSGQESPADGVDISKPTRSRSRSRWICPNESCSHLASSALDESVGLGQNNFLKDFIGWS